MIPTSFGKVSAESPWLTSPEVLVRGTLRQNYTIQSDGITSIMREKPRATSSKTGFTYLSI